MKRTGQWHVWCQHAKGYVCACVCVCGQMGYNLEQETFVVLEGQCCVHCGYLCVRVFLFGFLYVDKNSQCCV